jgi:hypothetical protein
MVLGVRKCLARLKLPTLARPSSGTALTDWTELPGVLSLQVEEIRHGEDVGHKNRLGILLGNKATDGGTLTLTHTLWSLLNLLPAHSAQPPHRYEGRRDDDDGDDDDEDDHPMILCCSCSFLPLTKMMMTMMMKMMMLMLVVRVQSPVCGAGPVHERSAGRGLHAHGARAGGGRLGQGPHPRRVEAG